MGSIKIAGHLKDNNKKTVSPRTVRRFLVKNGFSARVASSKPLLSAKNKKARFEHAKEWLFYSMNDWGNIISSDTININLFQSDGRVYVQREDGTRYDEKNIKPTV